MATVSHHHQQVTQSGLRDRNLSPTSAISSHLTSPSGPARPRRRLPSFSQENGQLARARIWLLMPLSRGIIKF